MDKSVKEYCTTLKDLVGDQDPVSILSQTPARVRALITGAEPGVLLYKPAPAKWSIAEILAHLADSELVFGHRLRMILARDGTQLQAFDPDQWAATFGYQTADAHTSSELFASARAGTLLLLRTVSPALMGNAATHEEWGTETAASLVRLEAGHDLNHIAQIERILDTLGRRPSFTASGQKPEIPTDVAERVDLRVGTIVDIVPVADADRLMKLTVDFGSETRSVVAGIRAERGDPQVLVGRQALFYYNLPRKRIRGQVSEAMLCDVGFADGILPALLQPEWPVPNGTRAG